MPHRPRPTASPLALKRLGKRLKEYRGSRAQREIARLAGITQNEVSQYERGTRIPKLMAALKVAAASAKSLDEILRGLWPEYDRQADQRRVGDLPDADQAWLQLRLDGEIYDPVLLQAARLSLERSVEIQKASSGTARPPRDAEEESGGSTPRTAEGTRSDHRRR